MKLSRTDFGALAVVLVSGALGVALFGPQEWGDDSVTVDVLESHERHVRVPGDGDDRHADEIRTDGPDFEWRSESGTEEHVFSEENVFVARGAEGAEPLLYVDGERIDVPAGSERDAFLAEISPDRIERVEVIKGEAAERLFGPGASAGVIQIFTREGAGS